MLKKQRLLIKCFILFCFSFSFSTQATLLISPTKVTFNDRERSKQLILINTSNKPVTYRLAWEQKKVLADGSYQMLTEQETKTFPIASSMIRFSPKQVKLQPGERQIIKIAVRRPKVLEQGEYRSHLKLHAIPDERPQSQEEGMSIKLNMLFSYVLPVVVRKGEAEPQLEISAVSLLKETEKSKKTVIVSLSNNSLYSTTGNLIAYWQGREGKEEIVARLHEFTFYPDLNRTQARLIWPDECSNDCQGSLRLVFEGVKENRGKILSEYKMDINSASFQ